MSRQRHSPARRRPPLLAGDAWRPRIAGSGRAIAALAIAVGLVAGGGAIAFRELIQGVTWLFSGTTDYSAVAGAPNPHLPALGRWFVVLAPVVGGLLYGPLVALLAPEAKGHGVPEVMLAVARHGGRIRPRVSIVKAFASALCIGSGGSVGREGPIVQIGSSFGSTLGQLLRASEPRTRLLVACGAAGGISATFNAPLAGAFFAMEVILREWEGGMFGAVVLASVTADAVGRLAFGDAAFLQLPAFGVHSLAEYPLYAALGLLAAVVGVAFIRVLYGAEDLFDRLWRWPEWARPAVGGVLLGLLLLVVPEMYGVGYPVMDGVVRGHELLWFVVVLLVAKLVATSLTMAIGGSGGVFAPSLFMGAMLGSAYGRVVHAVLPGLTAPAGAYGIVGMAAVFAASARAPITAVLVIFEMTGDYSVILPLMAAVAIATGAANVLSRETIYTLKLVRRGIDILGGRDRTRMQAIPVGRAMSPLPDPLAAGAPLSAAAERFARTGRTSLPVVEDDGVLFGIVRLEDVERRLGEEPGDALAAREVAHAAAELRTSDSLEDAVALFARTGEDALPVLADGAPRRLVGWLTQRDVVAAYARAQGHARREQAAPPAIPVA